MGKIKLPLLIIVVLILILVALAIVFNGFKIGFKKTAEFNPPPEVYGVSGTIKNINGSSLTISAVLLWDDPSIEPVQRDIEVLVNEQTKITKLEFPKSEELTEEQIEKGFQAKETEIKLSDLKLNDSINITSEQNISENLKNKTTFTANLINVVAE